MQFLVSEIKRMMKQDPIKIKEWDKQYAELIKSAREAREQIVTNSTNSKLAVIGGK